MSKLSKDSYKGVRDFYPEDLALQKYIFSKWRKTAESFGYEEMDASLLEPTELYESKTGEEIVNEQTYTFTDRGDRRVTLRPEMTPTVARMIAKKRRELSFPVRWYSISNFFRYERPQKGRLREFYQMNCDLFGASGTEADTELLTLAYGVMKEFGAKDNRFEIRVNNRKLVNYLLSEYFYLDDKNLYKATKLIDKKNKMSETEFSEQAKVIFGESSDNFIKVINAKDLDSLLKIDKKIADNEGVSEIKALFQNLKKGGITNVAFDPTLVRGLDYYTGIVFEVFDTGKENNRPMFGGGRYDNLLEIFGEEALPTIGFAVGDVTMEDYLETYSLLPEYCSTTDLFICTLDKEFISPANKIAVQLREYGLNVVVNLSTKKIGDQIKMASKKAISYIVCVGEEEISSGKYKVKNLKTGEEKELSLGDIAEYIFS